MNACPAIPIRVIHESLEGMLHRKFNPVVRIKIMNTNNALDGKVKRTIRKLLKMERKAFWPRTKIPSGIKKRGTTSQKETSTRTNRPTLARVGLIKDRVTRKSVTGMEMKARKMSQRTDSSSV